jgi:hypothetical protein
MYLLIVKDYSDYIEYSDSYFGVGKRPQSTRRMHVKDVDSSLLWYLNKHLKEMTVCITPNASKLLAQKINE